MRSFIDYNGRLIRHDNLVAALEAAPGDRPFVTFWIDEDERETVTFSDFRGRARAQAAVLVGHGVLAGDRVVIVMPQGIPAMATFAGAMMLGAVPAFLAYPNFKVAPSKYRSGLAGVTANLNAKVVVIDEEFPEEMIECVSLGSETQLVRAVVHRAGAKTDGLKLRSREIQADGLAFIQHSAGTTGLQKGVALTHRSVLRQLAYLADALQIGNSDRIYSWLPLYHDMGLIACFMLPMACHLPTVMQSPLDWVMRPETLLQIVSEYQCTVAWMPNFAFQFVPRRTPASRWERYDLSWLRLLINCSEPVRTSSMEQFRGAFKLREGVLHTSYAMAENVFAVSQSLVGAASGPAKIWVDGQQFRREQKIVPVPAGTGGALSFTSSGRLLPHHEVQILSDSGEVLGEGAVGEITLRSDCLFEGYYNRPDLTAKAIVDGWYHSGDLGFFWAGELFVIGRKNDLLIVGGENLYPQDIEEIVAAHPAIHDGRVIALGVYNPELGTQDVVVVAEVESEAALANSAALEQEIRARIVAGMGLAVRTIYLKPPKWIVKSTAGKLARSATREKLSDEHPELGAGKLD